MTTGVAGLVPGDGFWRNPDANCYMDQHGFRRCRTHKAPAPSDAPDVFVGMLADECRICWAGSEPLVFGPPLTADEVTEP